MMAVFIAFKGDIIRLFIENAARNGNRYIALQVYHFSKSNRSFRTTVDKVLPLDVPTTAELQFSSVKCVVSRTSGIYQPSLLLRQAPIKSDVREKFHVLLLEDYDSVLFLGSFEVNHVETSQIELHLIDGPAVCWTLEGCLYFARYDLALEKITVDSLTLVNSMNEVPGVQFNFLWCGLLQSEMVAMGAKPEMSDDDTTVLTKWTCVSCPQNHIQEIPLVPHVYAAITTCCSVREPLMEATFGCSDSILDRLQIFLTTNRGQLLKFVNGCLKNCWQLPFNDPCRVWILEAEPDDVMIMVTSQTKKVCIVNCNKKQVLKEFDEVELIVIDDFLEQGYEQVVFLPHNPSMSESGELSDFSLVDLAKGMTTIEGNQDSVSSQPQSVTDSLQKTAQALRTRMQARASSLHEAKRECHAKMKMVEHCCKVLKDVTCSDGPGSKGKREKYPGLYCLLEGALGEGEQDYPTKVPSSTLNVKDIWQRIVYDQWIVGIDVENTSDSSVSDLVLGLMSYRPEDISYSAKAVFCCDNSRQHKQHGISKSSEPHSDRHSPSVKRTKTGSANTAVNQKQLLPGNQTRLTAIASLPRFTCSNSCTLSVVVTWTSNCVDGSIDRHSMHCGHVTLDSERIVNGSLNLNSRLDHKSIQQDIMVLRSVSIETELVFQSSFSSAHHITSFVKNSVRDVPVLLAGTDDDKDIFGHLLSALHNNGPLGGAGIVVKHEGHMTLVTRNKNQVYLLLHRLRQILPHDVRILADPAVKTSIVKNSLCTLNHEATNLQKKLHKLMEKARRDHAGLYTSTESGQERKADGVKALREGFERKRARERMGTEDISSDERDLAKLWSDFVQDQISTDSVIAKT